MNLDGHWQVAALVMCLLPAGLAGADRVECVNGDVLIGTVVAQDEKVVVLEHDVLGRLELPLDQVTTVTIDTPDGAMPETVPAEVEPPGTPAETPLAETPADAETIKKEIDYWDLAIDLAANTTTGNTDEQTLRFGLTASRITERTRLGIDSSYYWKATDSRTTDNKATLGVRNDWLIPESKWFFFTSGRLDYDQFESWEQRLNFQVGPGYQLIESDDLELDLLGGLGARKEFGSLNDDWKFEGLLGLDLRWQATGRQTVTFNFTYFPTTDADDYRARSTAQWRYALDEDYALSLIIGYLLEYQSIVDPGDEKTDFRFWVGLQFGF